VVRWLDRSRTDPDAAGALLRSIVDSPHATDREKRYALDLLMNQDGRDAEDYVRSCAQNPDLAPGLRVDAVLLLLRYGVAWQPAEWLGAFLAEPGIPERWRWAAWAALRWAPLLTRLSGRSRRAA
jgi:hypothetical protein